MGVSEVGARLVLVGKAEMLAGLRSVRAEVDALYKGMATSAAKAARSGNPLAVLASSAMLAQKQMAADTERQMSRVATVGKAAFFGVAGAAVLASVVGLKQYSQFNQALTQSVTLAGIAKSRMGALSNGLLAMAPAVNQGPVALANALYRIASSQNGLHATNAQLLAMTKAAGQLATIGGPGTDLEQTARIIGGIKATGVKGAGSPQNIVSLAAATVGAGDMRMQDFVDFVGTGVLASSKLSGVTLPQIAATASLLGDNLMSGQVSGHSMAHALQLLAAPSGVALKAEQAVGIDPSQMGILMQTKGLPATLQYLINSLHGPLKNADPAQLAKYGLSPAQIEAGTTVGWGQSGAQGSAAIDTLLTRMFGGAKQAIPIETLITEYPRYQAKLAQLNKQSGKNSFANAWGTQTDTLSYKTGRFTKSLDVLATKLGKDLTPAAKAFLTVGADVATWLGNNQAAALGLAGALTAILGPAMGLYLVRKFKDASGAISDVGKGYVKLVRTIFTRLIPGLGAEDVALGTTTAAERALGATAVTVAGEEAAAGGAASLLALLGGAAAAGAGSYAISNALSSHFDSGNVRYGTATANAQIAKLTHSPLVKQAQSIAAKIAADQKKLTVMKNQSGWSDFHSAKAWESALTFGATGKEAEYNRLLGEVAQYKKQLSQIQTEAAGQDIHITVNLDGKTVAKSTVKQVRQQVARR